MGTILALPGLTHLITTEQGEIVVAYDGHHYTGDEVLPTFLLSQVDCPTPPCTARAYVLHFMTRQFGFHRENWPQIALDFVAAKSPTTPSLVK